MNTEDVSHKHLASKPCTLWTHEKSFSEHDIVLNVTAFATLGIHVGSLIKIVPYSHGVAVRDFQDAPTGLTDHRSVDQAKRHEGDGNEAVRADEVGNNAQSKQSTNQTRASGTDNKASLAAEVRTAYICIARDASEETKSKYPQLSLSVSNSIALAFGFRNRMQVAVAKADSTHWASHVELSFRDEYLARSDMWRLVVSELAHTTVYQDQKLLFVGTIKATVKSIYRDGQRRKSAYFASSTKPIFRSESSRNVLLIQMSREMWDFDVEASGEIMFNKVINGFLPDLFKRWSSMQAKHLVTIVLFTRVHFDGDYGMNRISNNGTKSKSRDFYRVVSSDMASGNWIQILHQLKKEFRTFLRDVTTSPQMDHGNSGGISGNDTQDCAITGRPCAAADGNILEAIVLAAAQYAKDYIDRDLVRTGISIVVVTAGTGIFNVEYSMLKMTTDTLVGTGIGLDMVSLSPMPLHSVPLFRYRNPGSQDLSLSSVLQVPQSGKVAQNNAMYLSREQVDQWSFAMPHWLSISFWSSARKSDVRGHNQRTRAKNRLKVSVPHASAFHMRCRLHELQMMGIMETEMSSISIRLLHENETHPWHRLKNEITGLPVTKVDRHYLKRLDRHWMDSHDDDLFSSELRMDEMDNRKEDAPAGRDQGENDAQRPSSAKSTPPPPRSNYLEWSFASRVSSVTTEVRRKMSQVSLMSKREEPAASRAAMPRQMSLIAGGFGSVKAAPTTDLTVTRSSNDSPTFSRQLHPKSPAGQIKRSDLTSKIQASLSRPILRPPSGHAVPSRDLEVAQSDSEIRTKPISIVGYRDSVDLDDVTTSNSERTTQQAGVSPSILHQARMAPTEGQESNGAILYAASSQQRPTTHQRKQALEVAASSSRTLSPGSALAPWLVLVNPCNPKKNESDVANQFRRWQHVFPRPLRTASMKWKSLCSPASVPLTNEYFPNALQLAEEYEESPYNISVDTEESDTPLKARALLVRELISARLSHGFQFVIGNLAAQHLGTTVEELSAIFDGDFMSREGDSVLMSVGNTIHQLTCASGNEVEVRRFNRKAPVGMESSAGKPFTVTCQPYIRTALSKYYERIDIVLKPPRLDYNWNFIDQYLAGYQPEISNALRFWRARFVLIPVNLPENRTNLSVHAEDSAEELRLEGIFRLTQMWQRHRVWDEEQRVNLKNKRTKDINPLAIEYQTRDPSVVVSVPLEGQTLLDGEATAFATQLFNEKDQYETSNIDLQVLAQDLQSERGVRISNRRWHWRFHYNCFLGFDLTSWLLQNFRDISTREEAVDLGNSLIDKGLFSHVQKKHNFRDGQYFYQLAEEYAVNRGDIRPGWFRAGRADKSVPVTPLTELQRTPLHSGRPITARPSTSSSSESDDAAPNQDSERRRKVQLSRCLKYDMDPRKRSYRPEVINLHYDRLHNPDNCYHIRVDWMNVTSKLIEDHIVQWATTVERYGLRLVEVPIGEASIISSISAFRSPYIVKLAELPPPIPAPHQYYDTTSFTPHRQSDRFTYHKALLRKLDFVQDVEAASSFPPNVDVTYSWGKPDYRYTQYIHKSGVLLVQIRDEGDFLLVANRLFNNRAATSRETNKFDKGEHHEPGPRRVNSGQSPLPRDGEMARASPTASPLVRATMSSDHRHAHDRSSNFTADSPSPTAEQLKDEFEQFCGDATKLRAFYAEALRPRTQPSPWIAPPVLSEDKIPSLGLGPSLTLRTGPQVQSQRSKSSKDAIPRRLGEMGSPSPKSEKSCDL